MKLSEDTPITKKALEALGFTIPDHENKDLGNGMLERDGIMIWDPGFGEGWISWALDQGGLDLRFRTLGDLNKFWIGCQRHCILQDNGLEPKMDPGEVESEIDRLNRIAESLDSEFSGLKKDFEKLRDEFNSSVTESDMERIAERVAQEVFDRNQ